MPAEIERRSIRPKHFGKSIPVFDAVAAARLFADLRQLSENEIYRVTTQATEEVMFVINYRKDITTENVILYKGVQYNIVRLDVFEGYKSDLTLYCKRQA